jgi:hypothetical protein
LIKGDQPTAVRIQRKAQQCRHAFDQSLRSVRIDRNERRDGVQRIE